MDIKLRLEQEHSKTLTTAIVKFIDNDKKRFKTLLELFLKGDHKMTQRAAWPLSFVAITHPELIQSQYGKLIDKLEEEAAHPAVARNILRIFEETGVPEKYQGRLVDLCFKYMMNESLPIATRAFAITNAANICRKYPDLKNEFLILLKEVGAIPQSAAISHRIKLATKVLRSGNSKL